MREEIRVNRGRGVALSENKRENRSDTLKNVTPRPKEERGHSNKVTKCHGTSEAIHTARGASFKKPAEVKVTSSIKADSLARDKKGDADLGLEALSYHSCQSPVLFLL